MLTIPVTDAVGIRDNTSRVTHCPRPGKIEHVNIALVYTTRHILCIAPGAAAPAILLPHACFKCLHHHCDACCVPNLVSTLQMSANSSYLQQYVLQLDVPACHSFAVAIVHSKDQLLEEPPAVHTTSTAHVTCVWVL